MKPVVMPQRGRLALGAALLALLAGGLALPHAAHAAATDNTVCKGSLSAGEKSVDFENPLAYKIACSNYITSYSIIMPGKSIVSIETEVFGTDATTGQVVPTDSFSCNGDLPGYGINCVGTYGGKLNVIPGQVDIAGNRCAPSAAYFVVTYATYATNSDGSPKLTNGLPTVTTNTAGPFKFASKIEGCSATKRVKSKGA